MVAKETGTKNSAKLASEVPSPEIPSSKTRGDKSEVRSTKPHTSKKAAKLRELPINRILTYRTEMKPVEVLK